MKKIRKYVWILLCISLSTAKVWMVPERYTYIQDAINSDSTVDGDTVSVRPGDTLNPEIYYENIDFKGKNIIVSARNLDWTKPSDIDNPDPRATVIDGSNLETSYS